MCVECCFCSYSVQAFLDLAAQGKMFMIELETKQTNKPKHNADN